MEFLLIKFLKGKVKIRGEQRFRTLQPIRHAWLKENNIPLFRREGGIEFVQSHNNEQFWGSSGYSQREFCFVEFYVEIPDDLLDDWNEVHINKQIPRETAKGKWGETYEVTVRNKVKGLTLWSKTNIKGEYYIAGKVWGFKDKNEAIHFGMVWK